MRLPVGTLRTGLGVVLIGAGLGLLSKAGANIPAPVLAAAPVALFVLVLRHELAQRAERLRAPAPTPATVE